MVDFYIDEVFPKGESYPLVVNFQNGNPTDNFRDQVCVLLENNGSNRKSVVTDVNGMLYYGDECEEPLERTLILARNRKTGKIRIMEVENVDLKPVTKLDDITAEHETSYIDLGKKFGSKRHKKMLEQNEKLKVNEEVVSEQLKDLSQNISLDQLDLSAYNKTDSEDFYIPPINREATCVEDIYALTSILTEEQYDTIYQEIDDTEYRSNLFPLIRDIFSEKLSKEQLVLAVYASTLLSCYVKPMTEIKTKKFVGCPFSVTLDKIVLSEFFTYNNNFRHRSQQYKDKSLCHAIVFMFLINNYKLEMEPLLKELKMAERTGVLKVNMTGGWVIRQGSKKVAILKLPLNKAGSNLAKRKRTK